MMEWTKEQIEGAAKAAYDSYESGEWEDLQPEDQEALRKAVVASDEYFRSCLGS